jgi:hypothetical protein
VHVVHDDDHDENGELKSDMTKRYKTLEVTPTVTMKHLEKARLKRSFITSAANGGPSDAIAVHASPLPSLFFITPPYAHTYT